MHHTCCPENPDGFESIKTDFVKIHGAAAIIANAGSNERLSGAMRDEFIQYHKDRTQDYRLCEMISVSKHREITARHNLEK